MLVPHTNRTKRILRTIRQLGVSHRHTACYLFHDFRPLASFRLHFDGESYALVRFRRSADPTPYLMRNEATPTQICDLTNGVPPTSTGIPAEQTLRESRGLGLIPLVDSCRLQSVVTNGDHQAWPVFSRFVCRRNRTMTT